MVKKLNDKNILVKYMYFFTKIYCCVDTPSSSFIAVLGRNYLYPRQLPLTASGRQLLRPRILTSSIVLTANRNLALIDDEYGTK